MIFLSDAPFLWSTMPITYDGKKIHHSKVLRIFLAFSSLNPFLTRTKLRLRVCVCVCVCVYFWSDLVLSTCHTLLVPSSFQSRVRLPTSGCQEGVYSVEKKVMFTLLPSRKVKY